MNKHESQQKREEWIIDYLYGELSDTQKAVFEQALENDEQLKLAYEEQRSLDEILPMGSAPVIESDRMQAVRWNAFRGIREGQEKSVFERFLEWWGLDRSLRGHALGMVLMFVAGFLLKGLMYPVSTVEEEANSAALAFVKSDDYQIVDMNLDSYDQTLGDVSFSFALASQSKVKGNLNNPRVLSLMLETLHTGSNDDVRIQLTELLGLHLHESPVREALIFTLLNDPNPGVRYGAVEHLVQITDQPGVKDALRQSLAEEVNPGIRVEAFLSLTQDIDDKTLKVLKEFGVSDGNALIRERSKRILFNQNELNRQSDQGLTI